MNAVNVALVRDVAVEKSGGVYSLDYEVATGKQLLLERLWFNVDVDSTVLELLWSNDNKNTWINPFDAGSNHLLRVRLGAKVVWHTCDACLELNGTGGCWLRIKITNNNPTTDANMSFALMGIER